MSNREHSETSAADSAPDGAKIFMKSVSDSMLSALTPTQIGFIVSIRAIDVNLQGKALRSHVAELFPPAHLFSKEISDMPSVWMELRSFLDSQGSTLQKTFFTTCDHDTGTRFVYRCRGS